MHDIISNNFGLKSAQNQLLRARYARENAEEDTPKELTLAQKVSSTLQRRYTALMNAQQEDSDNVDVFSKEKRTYGPDEIVVKQNRIKFIRQSETPL